MLIEMPLKHRLIVDNIVSDQKSLISFTGEYQSVGKRHMIFKSYDAICELMSYLTLYLKACIFNEYIELPEQTMTISL